MKVTNVDPWLIADLDAPRRVLSWTLNRPGFATAQRIVFREVRNRDLPAGMDAKDWLDTELSAADLADAPTLLTSRTISTYQLHHATSGNVSVSCLATAGLSNAERIGHRQCFEGANWGTINMAVECSAPLTEAAQIEALTIVAQARTAAVMDAEFILPQGPATGTGTDCIAIAAPSGNVGFAGLHTDIGEALGRASYDAVTAAVAEWLATRPDLGPVRP